MLITLVQTYHLEVQSYDILCIGDMYLIKIFMGVEIIPWNVFNGRIGVDWIIVRKMMGFATLDIKV